MNVASRPPTDTQPDALQKILEAAERTFAEHGFDGAGMKALATRAQVSQSLLHYHFGSKGRLYEAVIRNRSTLINDERRAMLDTCDLSAPDGLAQVFRALYAPALGPSGGGRAYARIFAGLIAGNARDQALVRDNYDETARSFIAAIRTCLPRVSGLEAAQIYLCALGVLATSLAKDGRAERLSRAPETPRTNEELVNTLVRFALGGAEAFQNE
ncbi:TetR/AcrR family transcriptional regulator [Sulfitobacter aestuariivivens]|uniref:TetR/AcrR family transcriptional regulator n=1 Tax=Sulfitobacter aestuariivivens TaxID=2766981 RepID=A0A927D4C3_9RHOB|nr:TetR/AcrR family transcriptional regulator [Sulfitobacter aestuariivivens]MBD3664893.1 TetR/AcrR family transcriptional regulator [Sulfitobacter aestuariivivens]